MTEQQVKVLVDDPPVIAVPRWEQIAMRTCAVVGIVGAVTAAVGVGKAYSTATCVNTILASRAAPTAADARAHVLWASALKELIEAPRAQQKADYAVFVRATDVYVATLRADQQNRNAHPLGRC